MAAIADANAILNADRVLPQHQAALTLLRARLQDPACRELRWLDLACGRGQILVHAKSALGESHCSKVRYLGIDADQDYARQTEQTAGTLFKVTNVTVCGIHNFERLLTNADRFDFITFTNSAHEIRPQELASALVAAILRVSPKGHVFIYDVESLAEPELGAIPWRGPEMQRIVNAMLKAAGVGAYVPHVAQWPHATCMAWNLSLERVHLGIAASALRRSRAAMEAAAAGEIHRVLVAKMINTQNALDAVCRFGPTTSQEAADTRRLLYDYWAISRALGTAFGAVRSD